MPIRFRRRRIGSRPRRIFRRLTKALDDHPLVEIDRAEIDGLPPATGAMSSRDRAFDLCAARGRHPRHHGRDAWHSSMRSPIVHRDSIDMSAAWFQSRYDKVGPAVPAPIISIARMNQGAIRPFVDA